eukprot:2924864-Rhodomonas_salina.1
MGDTTAAETTNAAVTTAALSVTSESATTPTPTTSMTDGTTADVAVAATSTSKAAATTTEAATTSASMATSPTASTLAPTTAADASATTSSSMANRPTSSSSTTSMAATAGKTTTAPTTPGTTTPQPVATTTLTATTAVPTTSSSTTAPLTTPLNCAAGQSEESGVCALCAPGFWCPGGAVRNACPGSTTSMQGSSVVSDCSCPGSFSLLLDYGCADLASPQLTVSGNRNSRGEYVGFVRVTMVPLAHTNLSYSLGNDTTPLCTASDGQESQTVAVYESTVIKAASCGLDRTSSSVVGQAIEIKEGGKVKIIFVLNGNIGNTPEVRRGLRRRFGSLFGLQDDQVLVRISDIRRRLLQASVEVDLLAEDQA